MKEGKREKVEIRKGGKRKYGENPILYEGMSERLRVRTEERFKAGKKRRRLEGKN